MTNTQSQPAVVGLLGLTGYTPLSESDEGLVGQMGYVPWQGGQEPIYDPLETLWEIISEATGKSFMWAHKTQCFGVPSGSCNNLIKPEGGSYCYKCAEAFDRESTHWRNEERRTAIISEGVSGGWIPRLFEREFMYDSLHPQQMTAYVELQAHDLQCAWIVGMPGRGKTVLCYKIMGDYLKFCRKAAYCDAPIIHESRRNKTLFDALCESDLLVIDDLPKGFDAGWMVSQLHAILQARHEPRRRTIVTSEMTGSKCNDVFKTLSGGVMGASTLDRLCFPHAQCVGIELTGDNLRRA